MDIYIFGSGDYARLIRKICDSDTNYKVKAFVVDSAFLGQRIIDDLPVITLDELIKDSCNLNSNIFVAIGYSSMRNRADVFKKLKSFDFNFVNIVSHGALIHPLATYGKNNFFVHGCNIGPNVVIGDNNHIGATTILGHDVVVGNNNYIAGNGIVAGYTIIKDTCFIGLSCTIFQNLVIESECLISAGSLVNKSTDLCSMYMGVPAKKISEHADTGVLIKSPS